MRVAVLSIVRAAVTLALVLSTASFAEEELTQRVSPLPAPLLGETIPKFFTLGIDNETEFNSDDLRAAVKKSGAKRVVLSFFATWCANCMKEFSILKNSTENLKKNGVQIYLIDTGERIHDKGALVEKFVKEYANNAFPFYFDPNSNTLKRFGLIENNQKKYELPIIVVMDANLKVLGVLREVGDDFPQILWGDL